MVATRRATKQRALVTGGAGFLGRHLIQQLLDSGKYEVTCFDLQRVSIDGCTCVAGDLSKAADVDAAVAGQDIVFHTATAAPSAQNAANAQALMRRVNVTGTVNIIAACRASRVPRLVYTSSASVAFSGAPMVDVDESAPYPERPMDFYTGTKAEAERLVLDANGPELATCSLRPSGIFGPGEDRNLVPGVVSRARAGKMKYIIGDGTNLFDWTYVGNVAHAHLCAAERLSPGAPAAGEAFFITNCEPSRFWDMMGDLCEGLGYPRPSVRLPVWLMMFVAIVAAALAAAFGLRTDLNPTRVRLASVQRTVKCDKARRLLGYEPVTSLAEGKRLTVEGFAHLHKDADVAKEQ